MSRIVLLLVPILAWSGVAYAQTGARHYRAVSERANYGPRMDRSPVSDATFDSLYTRRGYRIVDVRFFSGFSPGGPRDIPESEIDRAREALDVVGPGQRARLHGATDPERFHSTRKKVTDMFNYTLGLARANYINVRTGKRAEVSTDVVMNDRRGVYLVVLEPEAGAAIAGPLPSEGEIEAAGEAREEHENLEIGPTVGVTYLHAHGEDYFTPHAGVLIRKDEFALYATYGRTFDDTNDDRVMTSGLRYGENLFLQVGFIDARRLISFFDMYTKRAVGGTIGGGIAGNWGMWQAQVNAGIAIVNVVTPEKLEDEWDVGFTASGGVGFTF